MAGFLGKRDAEAWLLACEPGTFLLRFSNTQIGGISVAWVTLQHDGTDAAERCRVPCAVCAFSQAVPRWTVRR